MGTDFQFRTRASGLMHLYVAPVEDIVILRCSLSRIRRPSCVRGEASQKASKLVRKNYAKGLR